MRKDYKIRAAALGRILKGEKTTRVARDCMIHVTTLWRWHTKYWKKQDGFYSKPHNRSDPDVEKKIMLIKEHHPAITLAQTAAILRNDGIKTSISGIFEVWKRYNLVKRPAREPLSPFGRLTPETECLLEHAILIGDNSKNTNISKDLANIMNRLPSFPYEYRELLEKVPASLLSLHRRLEQLYLLFMKIPMPEFYSRIRRIRRGLEGKNYDYSAVIAGLSELEALHWMRTPEKELALNQRLRQLVGRLRDPIIKFQLNFYAAAANIEILAMPKAKMYLNQCRTMLRFLPHPALYELYADLMTFLADYTTAGHYDRIAMNKNPPSEIALRLRNKLAHGYAIAGHYGESLAIVRKYRQDLQKENPLMYLTTRALTFFGQGRFEETVRHIIQKLERSEKQQLRNEIYINAFCLAAVARAMGKDKEAKSTLKEYLPLLVKYRATREWSVLRVLLREKKATKFPEQFILYRILLLLDRACRRNTAADYRKALSIAQKKGLVNFFHRCLVFFPESVIRLLHKGLDTGLPKPILDFPVFNTQTTVYHLKFLGPLVIFRNQHYLKTNLLPKEEAMILYLARHVNEPGKSLMLKDLYRNFWSGSRAPAKRLTHVLVDLRRKLKIPIHLIKIYWSQGAKRIVNEGIFFTSDYDDLQSLLAQGNALCRFGEWKFARNEYLKAFRLYRGEPLKRCFDNWSLDFRHAIISQFEQELNGFVQSCVKFKDASTAKRLKMRLSTNTDSATGGTTYID